MYAPIVIHWEALEQILRYLKRTPDLKLYMVTIYILALSALLMLIRLDVKPMENLLLTILYLLGVIWCHGELRNKSLYCDPVRNLNIELRRSPQVRSCGYITYWHKLEWDTLHQQNSSVIIKLLFILKSCVSLKNKEHRCSLSLYLWKHPK